MAIDGACQLWIEQQIEEGREAGKSDGTIGREVANEILKFFGVDAKHKTIAQKSRRERKRAVTNVTDAKTQTKSTNNAMVTVDIADWPKCKKCKEKPVEKSYRTMKPLGTGLCSSCRSKIKRMKKKEKQKRTKGEQPKITVEREQDQEQKINQNDNMQLLAWEEINSRLCSLVQFILDETVSPVVIHDSIKLSINENLRKLETILNMNLNGER